MLANENRHDRLTWTFLYSVSSVIQTIIGTFKCKDLQNIKEMKNIKTANNLMLQR